MKTNSVLTLLSFILINPLVASADELSLADCVRMAHDRSPLALEGRLREITAGAVLSESNAQKRPHVVAAGSLDKSDDSSTQLHDANKAVLRVEQSLYPGGPRWTRSHQRATEAEAATLEKIGTEQDVALSTKQLYFSILRDQDAIASLDEIVKELEQLRETILPRYTVGRIPPFDLVKVKASLSDLARTRELTEAQLKGEKKQMSQLTGIQPNAIALKPVKLLPELPTFPSDGNASPSNPHLEALARQESAAMLGIKAARAERYPELTAALESGYAGQTTNDMTLGWDAAIAARLPIWDGGEIRSRINQEKTASLLAKNKLAQETQRLTAELDQALALAEAHLSDQKRSLKLLPEAHESALVSVKRYRQGASGILEATDAVSLWLQTRLNEQNAYYTYLSDVAQIERLVGSYQVKYEN